MTSSSLNVFCSSGITFLQDGRAAIVLLGFEGGVGIKLGAMLGNTDGGCIGRFFPR